MQDGSNAWLYRSASHCPCKSLTAAILSERRLTLRVPPPDSEQPTVSQIRTPADKETPDTATSIPNDLEAYFRHGTSRGRSAVPLRNQLRGSQAPHKPKKRHRKPYHAVRKKIARCPPGRCKLLRNLKVLVPGSRKLETRDPDWPVKPTSRNV